MTEIRLIAYTQQNQAVDFNLEAEGFTRKSIYGSRKVVALDKDGNLCKTAQLSSSGTEIYPAKGTGFVKLNSDGTIYENKADESTEAYEKAQHVFILGDRNYCITKIETENQLNEFFEQEIEKLYVLGGINSQKLMQFINEDLFEVHLNGYRKGYIFCRNGRLFLEVGKDSSSQEKHSDFIKKENYDFLPDSDFTLDDIDFGMM